MLTRGASVQSRSTARATNPRDGAEIIPTTSTPRVGGTTAGRRRTISMTTSTSMPVRATSDRKTQCASRFFFFFPGGSWGGWGRLKGQSGFKNKIKNNRTPNTVCRARLIARALESGEGGGDGASDPIKPRRDASPSYSRLAIKRSEAGERERDSSRALYPSPFFPFFSVTLSSKTQT